MRRLSFGGYGLKVQKARHGELNWGRGSENKEWGRGRKDKNPSVLVASEVENVRQSSD